MIHIQSAIRPFLQKTTLSIIFYYFFQYLSSLNPKFTVLSSPFPMKIKLKTQRKLIFMANSIQPSNIKSILQILMKIIIILLLVGLSLANLCCGNCPSKRCQQCHCGCKPYVVNIADWCARYSWNQKCCNCIVDLESDHGNSNAINYNKDSQSYDVGLWQINSYWWWNDCNQGKAPCDPQANLKCAIMVYKAGGNTWKYWVTSVDCGCKQSS